MKKIIGLLAALMLCLPAAACAEAMPSKTIGDLVRFEVSAENLPEDSGFCMMMVTAEDEASQRHVAICQNELTRLAQSESVAAYFGEVRNAAGEVVDMHALLGSDTLHVHEFCAIAADMYQERYGSVCATLLFATPYAQGDPVLVLIGLVDTAQEDPLPIAWTAYEGVGVGDDGGIQVVLDAEIILAIQNGTALLAIVSK